MHWLPSLDVGVFRFINTTLANPLFDRLMPWLGGNTFFYPALVVLGIFLVWKGGIRGLVCVSVLLLILPMGDHWVCRSIKRGVERPRPFAVLPDVHLPAAKDAGTGKPPPTHQNQGTPVSTGSMPSSHAANWFAATMVAFIYYRRSLWVMLPAAVLVSFSRVYNGVHYPSDVMAGAILGAGYSAAALWLLEALWQGWGRKWFPLWWARFPSLIGCQVRATDPREVEQPAQSALRIPNSPLEKHWLRLGYILIAVLLLARLVYIGGDSIQLTGDEAYQWLWSKHLALSYYSKPPLIAYAQFVGTTLFGDTAFGVHRHQNGPRRNQGRSCDDQQQEKTCARIEFTCEEP